MATATIKTRSIQGESLSAATDRLVNTILLNEGVVDKAGNSYQVLQDTGSNMAVKVGSGTAFDRAVVEGDVSGQGTFIAEHQNATQALTIAASDPSNPRIDGIDLVIKDDTFDSSTLDEADLIVTQGTPAVSPTAPAVPSTAIRLATVEVGAGVTAITNANITDTRVEATLPDQLGHAWQAWSPSYTNLTVGDGSVVARYTQAGKLVVAWFQFTLGSTSAVGSAPTISTPVAASSSITTPRLPVGVAQFTDSGTGIALGRVILQSATTFAPLADNAASTYVLPSSLSSTVPHTWTSTDLLSFSATYEAA